VFGFSALGAEKPNINKIKYHSAEGKKTADRVTPVNNGTPIALA